MMRHGWMYGHTGSTRCQTRSLMSQSDIPVHRGTNHAQPSTPATHQRKQSRRNLIDTLLLAVALCGQ